MRKDICKSYRGPAVHETCKAGVNFKGIAGGGEMFFPKLPCIRRNNTDAECKCREFPTPEEVAAHTKEREEYHKLIDDAYVRCAEHAQENGYVRGQKGASGFVDCPKCGKPLKYTIAASNGHIWAKCTKDGCLTWVQ